MLDDPALVHDEDAVGERGVLELVGDDDGHASGGDPPDPEEDGVLAAGVRPGGRFVQDRQRRPPVQDTSAHQALPLSRGQ
ncbi:hypothetical protein ABT269_12765 [Streptomyces viridosporus]|uniref:hypothetical protein n=1 Tax=Streptomyces viridosporus TaxID=67581 RepID=UPI003322C1DC